MGHFYAKLSTAYCWISTLLSAVIKYSSPSQFKKAQKFQHLIITRSLFREERRNPSKSTNRIMRTNSFNSNFFRNSRHSSVSCLFSINVDERNEIKICKILEPQREEKKRNKIDTFKSNTTLHHLVKLR